jgi:hypothetical protein
METLNVFAVLIARSRRLRAGAPLIRALLSLRRPPAIARSVVFCVVESVKRFCSWAFAHIGNEVAEVMPSTTNSNTGCAIPGESVAVAVIASAHHSTPRRVRGRSVAIGLRMSVFGDFFKLKASATNVTTGAEVAATSNGYISAVAGARPSYTPISMFGLAQYYKSTITLSGSVHEFHGHDYSRGYCVG